MSDKLKTRLLYIFWGAFFSFPFLLFLFFMGVWIFADIPSFEELERPDSKLATQIISSDNQVLSTFHIENRSYIPYEQLSPYIVQAAVATEDERFYDHSGIDFISLFRVLGKTIILHDSSQGGGSTITQQLAKTLYPRTDVSSRIPGLSKLKMVAIKMKEWITAIKLERDYTKNEIMDMYLNAVFFGSGAYGVKTAAMTFFAKDAIDLNIEESATLIGMINKPTRYNPALNPDKSMQRRNIVLSKMYNFGYITKAQCDSLKKLPIVLNYSVQDHNSGYAPYFRDMLKRYMEAKKPSRGDYQYNEDYSVDSLRWESDKLYGWLEKNKKSDGSQYNLNTDGLKIYTTIDSRMQRYAEQAVVEHLSKDLQKSFDKEQRRNRNYPFADNVSRDITGKVMKQAMKWSDRYRSMKKDGCSDAEISASFSKKIKMRVFAYNSKGYSDTMMSPNDSIRYYKSILRAAFMAMEPHTGHVKAYVGGPNYRYFKYDNAYQSKRQVGSTIKPFLYTVAMQEGMSPCTEVVNVPQTIITGKDSWTPRSTDKPEWIGKTVTLRWGLTNSSNNISVYLMKQYGAESMIEIMKKMGIGTHIDNVPSICLGSPEITLYDMVSAYNVYPSCGVSVSPIFVTKIEDNLGNTLDVFEPKKSEAISESTAYTMVDLMSKVIDNGTGVRLRYKYNISCPLGGKTGTTNDCSDGWFIAYSPVLTAGVWVGAEDRQVHFRNGSLGQGANMALPIWALFYKKVLSDPSISITGKEEFIRPSGYVSPCEVPKDNDEYEEDSYFD